MKFVYDNNYLKLIQILGLLLLPSVVTSGHLGTKKELIITTESTKQSIDLAKHLTEQGTETKEKIKLPMNTKKSDRFITSSGDLLNRLSNLFVDFVFENL